MAGRKKRHLNGKLDKKADKLRKETRGGYHKVSNAVLLNMIRDRIPQAMEALDDILKNGNHNAKMGAIRIVFNKLIPDLNKVDVEGDVSHRLLLDFLSRGKNPETIQGNVQPASELPAKTGESISDTDKS